MDYDLLILLNPLFAICFQELLEEDDVINCSLIRFSNRSNKFCISYRSVVTSKLSEL
jgi:hypothetical protein